MAYEFSSALRATGGPAEGVAYARALWIGREYAGRPHPPCIDAGFGAGYLGERIPPAKDVAAAERALDAGYVDLLSPGGRSSSVRRATTR